MTKFCCVFFIFNIAVKQTFGRLLDLFVVFFLFLHSIVIVYCAFKLLQPLLTC